MEVKDEVKQGIQLKCAVCGQDLLYLFGSVDLQRIALHCPSCVTDYYFELKDVSDHRWDKKEKKFVPIYSSSMTLLEYFHSNKGREGCWLNKFLYRGAVR